MRDITPEMMLIHLERQTIWWREIRSMEQSNKVGSRFPVKLNLTFRNSICLSQLNGFDATISLNMIWCYLHLEIHWQRGYHWWNPLQSLEQDTGHKRKQVWLVEQLASLRIQQHAVFHILLSPFYLFFENFCGVQFSNIVFDYMQL